MLENVKLRVTNDGRNKLPPTTLTKLIFGLQALAILVICNLELHHSIPDGIIIMVTCLYTRYSKYYLYLRDLNGCNKQGVSSISPYTTSYELIETYRFLAPYPAYSLYDFGITASHEILNLNFISKINLKFKFPNSRFWNFKGNIFPCIVYLPSCFQMFPMSRHGGCPSFPNTSIAGTVYYGLERNVNLRLAVARHQGIRLVP